MTIPRNKSLSFSLRTTKSLNRGSDSEGSGSRDGESTTGNNLTTLLATPDTNASSLDGILTAESTSVATDYNAIQTNKNYVLCWEISIFLTILRREEPYLVPYLPQIPTFLVLLPYNIVSGKSLEKSGIG